MSVFMELMGENFGLIKLPNVHYMTMFMTPGNSSLLISEAGPFIPMPDCEGWDHV